MAANNDFFVKFGSNAGLWARGLEKELAPANRAIANTEAMLDRLERKGNGTVSKLQRAMLGDIETRSGGRPTPAGSGNLPTGMATDLQKAASQIYALTDSLESTVRAIKGIPGVVERALRQANGHINQGPGLRPDQVTGARGRFTVANDPLAVNAQISSAIKRATLTPAAPSTASIASVGSSAVLEGGMKRIVESIEAQTKALQTALGNIKVESTPGTSSTPVESTAGTVPARTKKSKVVAATQELSEQQAIDEMMSVMRKGLADARTVGAQLESQAKQKLEALAAQHGVESRIYQEQKKALEAGLSSQRAIVAKMERTVDGVSRSDQQGDRRAAATKAREEFNQLPTISNKEIERRQREMALIRSTQDPNFLSNVGRKRDEYGKADVAEMARALSEQGHDPGLKARDSLDTMALKVQQAGERFQRAFADSIPDNLKTTGFQQYRETELPNTLKSFLSQANDEVIQAYARQREDDRRLLSQTYSGGDTGDLIRGRRTFGSGLAQAGSNTYSYTEQEIREAEERLKRSSSMERDTAMGLARQPDFDPYDPRVTSGIKTGSTPDERRSAEDARLFVRHLRDATTEIDRSGQAYVDAGRKIKAMDRILEHINRELIKDANAQNPEDRLSNTQRKFLREREDTYTAGKEAQNQVRAKARKDLGDLVDDPNFLEGLAQRRTSRAGYEQRVERNRSGGTLSDFQALRGGLGDALRQYMGSDFRYSKSSGRIGNANGLSPENSRDLNQAFTHYISQLRQASEAARQGVSGPDREKIDSRFENATVGLLNQMEKNFNGLAPKFEQLASLGLDKMGYPGNGSELRRIQNPDNLAGEERREARRREVEGNKRSIKKSDMGPEATAAVAKEAAERKAKDLAKAQEEQAQAVKELSATTRKRNANLKKMDAAERAAVEQAVAELRSLTQQRRALENIFLLEDEGARKKSMKDDDSRYNLRDRSVDATVDEFGYPSQLGYGTDLAEKKKQLESAIMDARLVANKAYGGTGADEGDLRKKMEEREKLIAGRQARTKAIADARSEGDLKENAGYHAARDAQAMAERRIKQLTQELTKASPVDKHEELRDQVATNKKVIASLEGQVEAANKKATAAAKKAASSEEEAAATQAEVTRVKKAKVAKTPTESPEIAALRSERATLQKDPHTRAEIKRLKEQADAAEAAVSGRRGGALQGNVTRAQNVAAKSLIRYETGKADYERMSPHWAEEIKSTVKATVEEKKQQYEADVAALKAARETLDARQKEAVEARQVAKLAAERYNRIKAINSQLDKLDGGSGAGGGGKKPPTGGGSSASRSGGGDDFNVLRQILAAINSMHNTLKKGGIKVSGAVSGTTGGTTKTPKTATTPTATTPKAPKQPGLNTRMTAEEKTRREAGLAEGRRLEDEARAAKNAEKQAAIERRVTREREKGAQALRDEARAADEVNAILGRLNQNTQSEVLKLNQLTKALDNATDKGERLDLQNQISKQQVRTYSAIDNDLRGQLIGGTDRRNSARAVLSAAGPDVSTSELNSIARTSRAQNPSMINRRIDSDMAAGVPNADQSEWMNKWGNGLFGNKGFWGRIVGSTGAFIVRNFAAGAVFGLTNALQTVLDQALQTEMTFVRVSQALEATNKPLGNLRGDLQNISTDYGVALNDVYTSAASMVGLFNNTEDLAIGTRVSTQLQVISNGALNANEAVGILSATYSAFQNDANSNLAGTDGLQRIADTLTLIQNELGVNVETSAEGVSSLAGAAESMGLSFQETAVYASQIAKLTNQTGAAAGEQFSRILGATLTGRGRGVLKDNFKGLIDDETGRDLGTAMEAALNSGDQGAVLENLMMGWNQLSKSQQDNIAVSLAGQRQMRSFQALMHDTEGTMALLEKAYHANGDAEDRMQALMGTLNKQVDVLMTNFQNFALALVESGILNFFQDLLGLVNITLKQVNDFFTFLNKAADDNALLGMLRDLTTWAVGAAVAFKVLGASVGGLRGALRNMRGEGANASLVPTGIPRANASLGDARARGTVPFGPVTRTQALEERVARPGYRSFGPSGLQTGISRTAAFAADRVVRVPLERMGRIVERGGMRWESSNNKYVARLGRGAESLGTAMGRFTGHLSGGLQGMGDGRSRVGGFLDRRVSSLDSFVAQRQARAEELRTKFSDQRRYEIERRLGPSGNPAGLTNSWIAQGMGLRETADRTSGADPALQRQARVQGALASAARGTSTVLSGTSKALGAVAESGLAMDAVLVGVGLAIAAVVSYRAQIKDLADTAEVAADAYKAPKKPEDVNPEDWMGEATKKIQTQIKDWNKNGATQGKQWGRFFSKRGLADDLRDLAGAGNPFNKDKSSAQERGVAEDLIGLSDEKSTKVGDEFRAKLKDIKSPLADVNVDGFRLEGLEETGKVYSDYMDRIGKAASGEMGYIPEALNQTNADFRKELEGMAAKVRNDKSLTEGQRTAWLALIEQLDGTITEEIADVTAVTSGLAQGLNSDQLGALQTALATAEAARTAKGGFDYGPIMAQQLDSTGLDADSDLQQRIVKLQRSGTDTADSLILQLKILQEAAVAARANWLTELAADPTRQSEGFQAADSQLNSLLSQLDSLAGSATETIISEAEGLAAAAEAAGQYRRAAQIRLAAIKQGERFNRKANAPESPVGVVADASSDAPRGFSRAPDAQENAKGKKKRAAADPALVQGFSAVYQQAVYLATKDITMQIARTSDAAKRAALELLQSQIVAGINFAANSGTSLGGSFDALPPGAKGDVMADLAPVQEAFDAGSKNYGDAVVSQQQVFESQVDVASAQTSYADAQSSAAEAAKSGAGDAASKAAEARQNAAALKQARLGVAQAAADARGDAVASAKIQVAMAKAQLQAARAELGAAKTASESAQARIAVLNAQAALIGAAAQVQSAQEDLIQSQYDVSIAMAEAAGNTVLAAERSLGAARQALAAARKKSKGKATAEVNAARVSLIQAQAAARDAALQDQLDTIDFNLEMGKMTQSSAISALQEILRTSDLTKAQRRQLLLQIKGMKDEMADSQWNFGDIKLPTPYQMRRYIKERRDQFSGELEAAAQGGRKNGGPRARDLLFDIKGNQAGAGATESNYGSQQPQMVTIYINGADTNKVRKIITDVVGGKGSVNTRTHGARRNR